MDFQYSWAPLSADYPHGLIYIYHISLDVYLYLLTRIHLLHVWLEKSISKTFAAVTGVEIRSGSMQMIALKLQHSSTLLSGSEIW